MKQKGKKNIQVEIILLLGGESIVLGIEHVAYLEVIQETARDWMEVAIREVVECLSDGSLLANRATGHNVQKLVVRRSNKKARQSTREIRKTHTRGGKAEDRRTNRNELSKKMTMCHSHLFEHALRVARVALDLLLLDSPLILLDNVVNTLGNAIY